MAERAFLRLLYGSHPYGHLAIGTLIGSADRASDVRRSMPRRSSRRTRRWSSPGSMSHVELRALAEREFGGWAPSSAARAVQTAGDLQPEANPTVRRGVVPARGRRSRSFASAICRPSRHAGLFGAARDERGARRTVRQPRQSQAAGREGIHLRRAHWIRLAARSQPVLAGGQRAHGVDRRRHRRLPARARGHPFAARPPTPGR